MYQCRNKGEIGLLLQSSTITLPFPAGNQQQTTVNNLNSRASKRRDFQVSYSWNQLENLDENKTLGGKSVNQKFCKIRKKPPLLNFLMAPKQISSFPCYSPLYRHSSPSPSYVEVKLSSFPHSATYSVRKPRLSTSIIWSSTIKCSRALQKEVSKSSNSC